MFDSIKEELYASYTLSELSDEELRALIGRVLDQDLHGNLPLGWSSEEAVERIFSSIRGLGILDRLLGDEDISEIMVNRYDTLYIERKNRLEKCDMTFESEQELEDIIQRIVNQAGREVNQANPIVDTRLDGGERVNIVLSPISIDTPVVTIRRFPKERITMQTLIDYGSITEEAAEFLEQLVRAKYNLFISGGTSSGKTPFLNALSDYIPKDERIITIEDSAELQLTGVNNLIRMETRNANTAGSGAVTMQQLIKTSLRMRPERIIVGEVRGAEALDMLNAMNTGHDGSLSTGHANSCYDMLRRLESMVLQGSAGLPLAAVRRDIASSLDVIIHLGKIGGKKRSVFSIEEVVGLQGESIELNPLFTLQDGKLLPTGNELKHTFKLREYGTGETARIHPAPAPPGLAPKPAPPKREPAGWEPSEGDCW